MSRKAAAALIASGLALLLLFPLAAAGMMALSVAFMFGTTAVQALGDDCLVQAYGDANPEATDTSKSQQAVAADVVQAAKDTSTGMNSAVLAIYVAYLEHGLQAGDLAEAQGSSFVGAFQQSPSWHPQADPATFGTANDPRLNPRLAAKKFLGAFRTLVRDQYGAGTHEPQDSVLRALRSLGVRGADGTALWTSWTQADLSRVSSGTRNAALLVLGHAMQGYAVDGPSVLVGNVVDGNADAQNAWRKAEGGWAASEFVRSASTGVEVARLNGDAGTSSVFVLGDSLSAGIADDLRSAGFSVNARTGRAASAASLGILRSDAARNAGTWLIELGSNNADTPGAAAAWVRKVAELREDGQQQVYWVLPWRDPGYDSASVKGGTASIVRDLVAASAAQADPADRWLRTLDWPALAAANPGWFPDGLHPEGVGDAALASLMTSAVGEATTALAYYDDANCDTGGGSTVGLGGVQVLEGDSGRFTDGPAPADAANWVPAVLTRAARATQDPPCDEPGCPSMCAQLAARVHGQSYGFYNPDMKRWAYSMFVALSGTGVDRGLTGSGTEFSPPVGAMLFWYMGPDNPGHVATYVGAGRIVTNYADSATGVVIMPAERLVNEYDGYLGWMMPPASWRG